MFKYYNMHFE